MVEPGDAVGLEDLANLFEVVRVEALLTVCPVYWLFLAESYFERVSRFVLVEIQGPAVSLESGVGSHALVLGSSALADL